MIRERRENPSPLSAYLLFSQEHREEVTEELKDDPEYRGTAGFLEANRRLSAAWKALPQAERDRYQRLSDARKQQYQRRTQQLQRDADEGQSPMNREDFEDRPQRRVTSSQPQNRSPTATVSAEFALFSQQVRPRIVDQLDREPDTDTLSRRDFEFEVSRRIAAEWNNRIDRSRGSPRRFD